jgi:hypothetical protein
VVQSPDQQLFTAREYLRNPVIVDPHLTNQRGHNHQVEHAGECVGVAGNVVNVRGAVHHQHLRFVALHRIGVILLQGIASGCEQTDVAIGEGAGQLVKLRRPDRLVDFRCGDLARIVLRSITRWSGTPAANEQNDANPQQRGELIRPQIQSHCLRHLNRNCSFQLFHLSQRQT